MNKWERYQMIITFRTEDFWECFIHSRRKQATRMENLRWIVQIRFKFKIGQFSSFSKCFIIQSSTFSTSNIDTKSISYLAEIIQNWKQTTLKSSGSLDLNGHWNDLLSCMKCIVKLSISEMLWLWLKVYCGMLNFLTINQ